MKNKKVNQTIRELIEEAKLDSNNYIKREQKCFNFQKYINFVVKELSKQNGINQSIVFSIIVEKGLESLKDEDFKEVIKERLYK